MSGREQSGVTISDVAAAAGVSRQTVSNVLKAPERVAPDTAARVRRAIEALGYRPNRAAQNLRQRTSRCIGLKIGSPAGVSNFLDRFLHVLTEAAGEAGYHVLLFTPTAVDEELAMYEDLVRTGTVDGFVLARSAFHHSMNYRSVVILGRGRLVSDVTQKLEALRTITDHIVPGRWDEVRGPNELEMKQTVVIAVPIDEVSAKIRVGPPVDDDEDYTLPVWAGVVPIHTQLGSPIADGRVLPEAPTVDVSRFAKRGKAAR